MGEELEEVGPHLLVAVGAGRRSEAAYPWSRDSGGGFGQWQQLSGEGGAARPG